ncbi:MAG: lysine--tRNA ligase [Dehalococcoidales bacterium]|nr:lysine--tRNA ligase [Dehalococcoidales bacterium]
MESRLDQINKLRREKLERLRERGINPYPPHYHRSHTTQEAVALLKRNEEGLTKEEVVSVAGRIMAIRRMGKSSFLDIRDGSGQIQLYCQRDTLSEDSLELLKDIDIGDIIGAQGKSFRTKRGEPSIEVTHLTLLAKSLQPLPEKWHGLSDTDTRYRQRYLDLIANTETKKIFTTRSQIITAIRQFLDQRGFLEVETPVLQASAGGALAQPFITHHHALNRDFYLRIALELYLKRLIVGGFDKVYEMGRIFRNEGISTKHNPEFTMLETYEAYADYNDVMAMLEEMIYHLALQVSGSDTVKFGDNTISFKPPWQRVEVRQSIIDYAGIDFEQYPDADSLRARMLELNIEADPEKDRGRLIDELLSTSVEPHLLQPTLLLHHPVDMSPLAKKTSQNPHLVERFEAFAGGMEFANAFTELNDPIEQRQRFTTQQQNRGAKGDTTTIDKDFLLALEHGMPPTGGLGVGIDRLVMLLSGQTSIRQVILFPQLREKVPE